MTRSSVTWVRSPRRPSRHRLRRAAATIAVAGLACVWGARAEAQTEPASRADEIAAQEAARAEHLTPHVPSRFEEIMTRASDLVLTGGIRWHPFFTSAYAGGGFTLGAGHISHVSAYNTLDVRGSYTFSGYKRVEAEFAAPRLFKRTTALSVIGGWREAPSVGFYGIGMSGSSQEQRVDYGFSQPYLSGQLQYRPTRRYLVLGGGLEVTQWNQESASSDRVPRLEDVYSPDTLPGLGAHPNYLHSNASFGIDTRAAPLYARRGGAYTVTSHLFDDPDNAFGFGQLDYDVVQHIPIYRDSWVVSLHGRVQTTYNTGGQETPFFMLPSLGGGSSLRAYSSWRYRDNHSLLLQGEWRIMVNRFIDTALFVDAGKVASSRSQLDLSGLAADVGYGARFHGPFATVMRVEIARGSEGFHLVFSSSAPF